LSAENWVELGLTLSVHHYFCMTNIQKHCSVSRMPTNYNNDQKCLPWNVCFTM